MLWQLNRKWKKQAQAAREELYCSECRRVEESTRLVEMSTEQLERLIEKLGELTRQ